MLELTSQRTRNRKTLLVGACTQNCSYAWPVKPKSPLKGFSFCDLGSDAADTYFRGNRVGYLSGDSGEPSSSASRGGGIAAPSSSTQKRHSPDYAIWCVSTGRATEGLGTTLGDSLPSTGKCLASPVPKGLTGYLTHSADTSLPQSSSLMACSLG